MRTEKNRFAPESQIARARAPGALPSASNRTQSTLRLANPDSRGAQVFQVLQSKKEKTDADTSAARNARSASPMSRRAISPAARCALQPGKVPESKTRRTPGLQQAAADAPDSARTVPSIRSTPPGSRALSTQKLRKRATPPQIRFAGSAQARAAPNLANRHPARTEPLHCP